MHASVVGRQNVRRQQNPGAGSVRQALQHGHEAPGQARRRGAARRVPDAAQPAAHPPAGHPPASSRRAVGASQPSAGATFV